MSQDAQGLPLSVFSFEPVVESLAPWEVADQGDSGLTEGPFEVGADDLVAGGPDALSGRGLLAFDEPGIGGGILHGREAADVMDLIEKSEAQDLSDTGDGVKSDQGLGVVAAGLSEDGLFEVADERIVGVAKGEIGLHALLEDRVVESIGNGFPLVLVDEAPRGAG